LLNPKKQPNMKSIKENPGQNISTEKSNSSAAMNLRGLLIDGLKDIYWAEKALTKAIPKMIKNATARNLADALEGHLEETKHQVTRLEEVFVSLDEKASARKCEAMEGLINEADHMMEETKLGAVRDAGIIAAAQKIEHYEIASYGTLATFAKTLGEHDAAAILAEIMEEEKESDEALTQLAKASINEQANDMDTDHEETDQDDLFEKDEDEEVDEEDEDEDADLDDYDTDEEDEDVDDYRKARRM